MADNRLTMLILLGLAVVPIATALADVPFWNEVASRIMILALAALGLNILLGFGGLVSMGHAAFIGVGAYVVAISQAHGLTNGWGHIALALGVTGGLGLVIGFLCLRTHGLNFIMISLAFAQMLYFFFISLEAYGGDDGIVFDRGEFGVFDLYEPLHLYYFIWAVLAVCALGLMLLVQSRFGVMLKASRSNAVRAESLGINPIRFQLIAFVLSAMIGGLAGVLFANWQEYASPAIMHWSRSGELLIIIALGGVFFGRLGTLAGPLLGAIIFLLLEELLPHAVGTIAPDYADNWLIVFGPILVFLVLMPKTEILPKMLAWLGIEKKQKSPMPKTETPMPKTNITANMLAWLGIEKKQKPKMLAWLGIEKKQKDNPDARD